MFYCIITFVYILFYHSLHTSSSFMRYYPRPFQFPGQIRIINIILLLVSCYLRILFVFISFIFDNTLQFFICIDLSFPFLYRDISCLLILFIIYMFQSLNLIYFFYYYILIYFLLTDNIHTFSVLFLEYSYLFDISIYLDLFTFISLTSIEYLFIL